MPARDLLPQRLAHIAFPLRESGGKLDAWVEETVIDRSQLDADAEGADFPLGRPKSRHAGYHMRVANLLAHNKIVNSRTPSGHHTD